MQYTLFMVCISTKIPQKGYWIKNHSHSTFAVLFIINLNKIKMKKLILCALSISTIAMGQTTDMVSLGSGYTNDSYYSFENGEEENQPAMNYDIALEVGSMGVGIRLNERRASLWVYPGAIADWATLDTANHLSWTQLRNGYEDWSEGAFNDIITGATYGWGEYTGAPNHNVEGTKIFLIQLSDNSYRKMKIDLTSSSSVYNITHEKLDNTDQVVEVIAKSDFSGKNFVYYDIATTTVIDREPMSINWDLVFTNYIFNLGGGYYGGTTGALHNKNALTSEVTGPIATSTYGTFEDAINTIGYDWKSYAGGAYSIVADLSYFVETEAGDIWKIVFTEFEGSSNGNIHFTKEKVATAGIIESNGANISVFPNPVNETLTVTTTQEIASITLINVSGQIVKQINSVGFSTAQISAGDLNEGVYFVQILDNLNRIGTKKIVVQH